MFFTPSHLVASIFTPLFFYSLQSLCLTHTGKPTGVAVSHCITWFQTQPIPHCVSDLLPHPLWDRCSTGQL